jgi:hypothetical protein
MRLLVRHAHAGHKRHGAGRMPSGRSASAGWPRPKDSSIPLATSRSSGC